MNTEMTIDEIINELLYLQNKKNEEFGLVPITGRGRRAINYAIKAIRDQQRSPNFCPHCGSSLKEVN
jgi:hypothetical protein